MRRELISLAVAMLGALTASVAQAQQLQTAPVASFGEPVLATPMSAAPDAGEPLNDRPARIRQRSQIRPYLEVSQVVSHDIDGGDTLTYTTAAAGVDGIVRSRRITVALSYRYQRNFDYQTPLGDTDMHSGVAMVNAQVIPGALQFDAGAMATRTGGEGRALGTTVSDPSVEVYSFFAGPSLSARAGPVAITGIYRLGYVMIDDDNPTGGPREDLDSSIAHNATASIGMAPGLLPIGWTVGAGHVRSENEGEFNHLFQGTYVRGDVVVPLSPTFAVTAGIGYEDIEASQLDFARDAAGNPVIGPDGRPRADPARPRVLTYQISGLIYDAGLIWRPTAHTELQARAGHRYGGTTVMGNLTHRFGPRSGVNLTVFDTVETFSNRLVNNISSLPQGFQVQRDPLTGAIGGCVFGNDPGSAVCIDQTLQTIRGHSARSRGAGLVFSGSGRLWSWGAGASYVHNRFGRPADPVFNLLGPVETQSLSLNASLGRQLSRTSQVGFSTFASWFDTNAAGAEPVFSAGGTLGHSLSFLFDRLQLNSSLGLYHTDDGVQANTVGSAQLGLRLSF
ncbi:MAG: hypothetical protein ACT4OE_01145 [Sphingosinicella sp.]